MSYTRAVVIVLMVDVLSQGDHSFLNRLIVIALGGILWRLTDDPLPAAIESGLEAFRRNHRR